MAREQNQRGGRRNDREETPEFADRLVAINRVSKTVKGGKAALALAKVKRKKSLRLFAKPLSKLSAK
jgi:ribosomal protein S5